MASSLHMVNGWETRGNHVYIHLSYRGTFFEEIRPYEGIINHHEIPGNIYPGNYHVLIGGEC